MNGASIPSNAIPAANLDAQASEWLVRIESAGATADDHAALAAWLSQSPRHEGAYIRAQAIWYALASEAVESTGEAGLQADRPVRYPATGRRGLLAAAGLGAILLAGRSIPFQRQSSRRIQTNVGEMRRIALTEGASVLMNTASTIEISDDRNLPVVSVNAGEAFFDLVHAIGAMTVNLGWASVQGGGAAFSVEVAGRTGQLLVAQGHVNLRMGAARSSTTIQGGHSIFLQTDEPPQIRKISPSDIESRLAWRTGSIVFSGETVTQAAAMMNRYNRVRIHVEPGSLGEEPVIGRFSVNDPHGFARAAVQLYGATMRQVGDRIELASHP